VFLHLGNGYLLSSDEIIAIVNLDNPDSLSRTTKDIIELGVAERSLVRVGRVGQEKSLIITGDKIYLSPISSITLQKRGQEPFKEVY